MGKEKGRYVKFPLSGKVIGVRKVRDNGRIQIPKEVRAALELLDGDLAYWMEEGGTYFIIKAREVMEAR